MAHLPPKGSSLLTSGTPNQLDFINTKTFCKRLNELFDPGEIFYNHTIKESDQEPFTFAETTELFNKAKKGSKLFRKELSKNKKIDLKLNKWIDTLDDTSITEEEIILANRALNWTDLGHDNLVRLRLYLKKKNTVCKSMKTLDPRHKPQL